MSMFSKSLLALLLAMLFSSGALAGSTSALSISDSISASVESLSDSVSGVSTSAKDALVFQEGDYRVVEIAAGEAPGGKLRLTLQAANAQSAEDNLYLYVREAAVHAAGVSEGQLIAARKRPYGMAVYGEAADAPFVLLLADAWRERLDARPVSL